MDSKYENLTVRISGQETIMHMVELIEKNLPCVFVDNFAGCAFMAAVIVKRKHPDLVQIVSVIHNDNKSLFDAHMILSMYIDKIFCVSAQIREHMQKLDGYQKTSYYFKEQPIETEKFWIRETNKSNVLRIGYAGRLVKQQKRADLLVDFIDCLEENGINYLFQIAGEGECVELIERHITEKHLSDRVQLVGRLPKSEMNLFWKKQDVFVNISEYEGTSLSMLEAMSYGCVPVVTDVSGAKEFITQGENGYICRVGDISGMSVCIRELMEDRKKLEVYADKCSKIIR